MAPIAFLLSPIRGPLAVLSLFIILVNLTLFGPAQSSFMAFPDVSTSPAIIPRFDNRPTPLRTRLFLDLSEFHAALDPIFARNAEISVKLNWKFGPSIAAPHTVHYCLRTFPSQLVTTAEAKWRSVGEHGGLGANFSFPLYIALQTKVLFVSLQLNTAVFYANIAQIDHFGTIGHLLVSMELTEGSRTIKTPPSYFTTTTFRKHPLPWSLSSDIPKPFFRDLAPGLDYVRVSPREELLNPEGRFNVLVPNYEPESDSRQEWILSLNSLFRWSIQIPWNVAIGGYNSDMGSVFGSVRPLKLTLETSGSMWWVNNATATSFLPPDVMSIPTTCVVAGFEAQASLDLQQEEFEFPDHTKGASGTLKINIDLTPGFWDMLLGPVGRKRMSGDGDGDRDTSGTFENGHDPMGQNWHQFDHFDQFDLDKDEKPVQTPVFPLGLANFTVSCPQIPFHTPLFYTREGYPSLDALESSKQGVIVTLSETKQGPLAAGGSIFVPFTVYSHKGSADEKMGATMALFTLVPLQWLTTSQFRDKEQRLFDPLRGHLEHDHVQIQQEVQSEHGYQQQQQQREQQQQHQQNQLQRFQSIHTPLSSHFPLTSAPTSLTLKPYLNPQPDLATPILTALVSTVIQLELFTPTHSHFSLGSFSIKMSYPGSHRLPFGPIHSRNSLVVVYIEPLGLDLNPEGKTWAVEVEWNLLLSFETNEFLFPLDLSDTILSLASRSNRHYFRFSFNFDVQGHNPWRTLQYNSIIEEVIIVFNPYNPVSPAPQFCPPLNNPIPLPINRWFHDAHVVFGAGVTVPEPNYVHRASFFDFSYETQSWDSLMTSTTSPSLLLFFTETSHNRNPDVISHVTIHSTGLYIIQTVDEVETDHEGLVELRCSRRGRGVKCSPHDITLTQHALSFSIKLQSDNPSQSQIPDRIHVLGSDFKFVEKKVIISKTSSLPSPKPTVNLVTTILVSPAPSPSRVESNTKSIHLASSFFFGQDREGLLSTFGRVVQLPKTYPFYFWILIVALSLSLILSVSYCIHLWRSGQKTKLNSLVEELVSRHNEREAELTETLEGMSLALAAKSPPQYEDLKALEGEALPRYLESSDEEDGDFGRSRFFTSTSSSKDSLHASKANLHASKADLHSSKAQGHGQGQGLSLNSSSAQLVYMPPELEPIPYNEEWAPQNLKGSLGNDEGDSGVNLSGSTG